jgi:hypothetical protein
MTCLHLQPVRRLRIHLSTPDYSGLTVELILGNEASVGINSRQGVPPGIAPLARRRHAIGGVIDAHDGPFAYGMGRTHNLPRK